MNKKIFFSVVIILISFTLSYAEDLVVKEAIYRFNEAIKAQQHGKFKEAEVAYRKVELLDPTNNNWQKFIKNNYGVMYIQQGNLIKAEDLFKEALKIDPNYKPAQLNLGLIYDRQGDEYKATKYWMQVFNMDVEKYKPKNFILEEEKRPGK